MAPTKVESGQIDPESGESLGNMEFIKSEVEIETTHPKFSVARGITRKIYTPLIYESLLTMSTALGIRTTLESEPLPIDPEDITPLEGPKERYIGTRERIF